VKENSDVERNENSSESGEESGEESCEEIEVEGIEIEGQADKIVESGGEIEGEECECQVEEIEPDTIDSTGPGSGPVGPDGSGPDDPVGSAGSAAFPGAAVPVISLLPPTPVKNKGKGKATSDDNKEDMVQNKPDFNADSLMVDNNELGRLKRGREHSGTGEVRGSKTQHRSVSHSTDDRL
jgi:hypothetical protein